MNKCLQCVIGAFGEYVDQALAVVHLAGETMATSQLVNKGAEPYALNQTGNNNVACNRQTSRTRNILAPCSRTPPFHQI